jgi:hypothetical protein
MQYRINGIIRLKKFYNLYFDPTITSTIPIPDSILTYDQDDISQIQQQQQQQQQQQEKLRQVQLHLFNTWITIHNEQYERLALATDLDSTSTVTTRVTSNTMTNRDGDNKKVSITTTTTPTVPNLHRASMNVLQIINFIQSYTTPVSINSSSTSTSTAYWKTSESISSSTSTNNHNSSGKGDMYDDDKLDHRHSWFHGSSSSDKHNAAQHHHQEQQHFYHHCHQNQIHTGGFVDDDTTEFLEDELLEKNHYSRDKA